MVIPKIATANLCKPNHDVIIVPVLVYPFNLETVLRKGKKIQKVDIKRDYKYVEVKRAL